MKLIKENMGRYINPEQYGSFELIRKKDKSGFLLNFEMADGDNVEVASITHERLEIKAIEQKAFELYERLIDFLASEESGVFDLRAEYEAIFGG